MNKVTTKAAETDFGSLRDNNLDTYAANIFYHILLIAKECIPNKVVTINLLGPPWLTTQIKRFIKNMTMTFKNTQTHQLAWSSSNALKTKQFP